LEWCTFSYGYGGRNCNWYGGWLSGPRGLLSVISAAPSISHCTFRNSQTNGLWIDAEWTPDRPGPTVQSSAFRNNANYGLLWQSTLGRQAVSLDSVTQAINGNTFLGNGGDALGQRAAIGLGSMTLRQSCSLGSIDGQPPHVVGQVTVAPIMDNFAGDSVHVTVPAGATVRFGDGGSLSVLGQLDAVGTEASPITFTTARIDPTQGNWLGVVLAGASPSRLEWCTLSYGAGTAVPQQFGNLSGLLVISGAAASVRNCVIRNSRSGGIVIDAPCTVNDPGPIVRGTTLTNNTGLGLAWTCNWTNKRVALGLVSQAIDGNTYQRNGGSSSWVNTGIGLGDMTLADSYTWLPIDAQKANIVGRITLPAVDENWNRLTLSIPPGSEVRLADRAQLDVSGVLTAVGTEAAPITVTSVYDAPQWGSWGAVTLEGAGTSGSRLEWCVFSYGYGSRNCSWYGGWDAGQRGLLSIISAAPTISHCTFRNSQTNGLWLENVTTATATGLPRLSSCKFQSNSNCGLFLSSATVVLDRCSFLHNLTAGLSHVNSPPVDARSSWWGTALGPRHATNPNGTGDAVGDYVLFDPWLTALATAPVLAAIDPRVVAVGDTLTLVLSAVDADGDPLAFSVSGAPSGSALVDSVFRWAPVAGQEGAHAVTFTVADPTTGADSETVVIAVTDASGARAVRPTDQWILLYGDLLTDERLPAPVGTVVDVVDGAGNTAAWTQVEQAGSYGYMPVYLDDPATEIDEGADAGEALTVRVNGVPSRCTAVWTEFGDVIRLDITAVAVREVNIALAAGFNLVSWNVDTWNDSIQSVMAPILADLIQVQGFETTALNPSGTGTGAKLFTPGGGVFNTLTLTDHRLGYWVKVRAPATLTIRGRSVNAADSTLIPLVSGYNLVSYLPETVDSTRHAVASTDGRLLQVQGFETVLSARNLPQVGAKLHTPLGAHFNTLRIMSPRLGYWVKVSAADTLVYPATPAAGTPMARLLTQGCATGQLSVLPTDQWVAVYGKVLAEDGSAAPTNTVVDVVDATGQVAGWVAVATPGTYGYMPIYLDDPTTEADEGANAGEWLALRVNGVATGTKIQWTQFGDIAELDLVARRLERQRGGDAPGAFAVHPCYPNPFNPTTTIRYELPEPGEACVQVYAVSGQLIRQLVAGHQTAGNHQVDWDGRDGTGNPVGNGVYLCELRAGRRRSVQRLVLTK
jgi:hypothetical protein